MALTKSITRLDWRVCFCGEDLLLSFGHLPPSGGRLGCESFRCDGNFSTSGDTIKASPLGEVGGVGLAVHAR